MAILGLTDPSACRAGRERGLLLGSAAIAFCSVRTLISIVGTPQIYSGQAARFRQFGHPEPDESAFPLDVVRGVARKLRVPRTLPGHSLAVDATIAATAARAGYFTAVWQPVTATPQYLVLIHRVSRTQNEVQHA